MFFSFDHLSGLLFSSLILHLAWFQYTFLKTLKYLSVGYPFCGLALGFKAFWNSRSKMVTIWRSINSFYYWTMLKVTLKRTAAAPTMHPLNDFRIICVTSPLYWHKYGKAAWIYENESETKAAAEFYVPTAFLDFPSGDSDKEPACQCRRCVFDLWARSPGGGHGNPLQYSCLENPIDREVWWATVHPWGCKESHMAEAT